MSVNIQETTDEEMERGSTTLRLYPIHEADPSPSDRAWADDIGNRS